MAHSALREIASGVYVAEAPQRFAGLEMGTRMTVLDLGGELLIHSPIAMDPAAVAPLGTPRWVLAPNKLHHLYMGPWIEAGLEAWGVRGLPEKRPDLNFAGIAEPGPSPFGADVSWLPLTCFPFSNEVVLLHRPSRTLVATDLVANIQPSAPWLTRFGFACLCGYPGCSTTLLERFGMRREAARREIGAILEWDFERIVLAHGAVVTSGGKDALRNAFRWLGL